MRIDSYELTSVREGMFDRQGNIPRPPITGGISFVKNGSVEDGINGIAGAGWHVNTKMI